MKKELCAGILLVLLCAGCLLNIRFLDGTTAELLAQIDSAEAAARAGDAALAEIRLNAAIDRWNGLAWYTHAFIRHDQIDSATDAFYDMLDSLLSGDTLAVEAAARKLRAHLTSIRDMEHITPGSIF